MIKSFKQYLNEQSQTVEMCVPHVLALATQLRLWHLEVKNKDIHTDLQALYDSLSSSIDSIGELYIGLGYNLTQSYSFELIPTYSDQALMTAIDDIKLRIEANIEELKYDSQYTSIIHELEEMHESVVKFNYFMRMKK